MKLVNERVTGMQGIIWGAIAGAALAMVVGFGTDLWTLQSTANEQRTEAVENAQIALYTPVCMKRYESASADVHAKFVAEHSWNREDVLKEFGFATPAGSKEPLSAVADACASRITEQLDAAAEAKEALAKKS